MCMPLNPEIPVHSIFSKYVYTVYRVINKNVHCDIVIVKKWKPPGCLSIGEW